MMEDYLDDRVIIPDYIKVMSDEELDMEIARLEKEAEREKTAILTARKNKRAV